jgi:hypothetical protein
MQSKGKNMQGPPLTKTDGGGEGKDGILSPRRQHGGLAAFPDKPKKKIRMSKNAYAIIRPRPCSNRVRKLDIVGYFKVMAGFIFIFFKSD